MAIGDIGAALIDSLQILCSCAAVSGDVVHVRGNIFAVVYHEEGTTDTVLATFDVDNCGNIAACISDSIVVDGDGLGTRPRPTMIKRTDNIVAVGYSDRGVNGGDAHVKTYSVDACGTLTLVDTQDINNDNSIEVWINHTKYDDVIAIVWTISSEVHVSTVVIDTSGNIGCVVDTQQVSTGGCGPDRVYGSPAIVWTGVGDFHAVAGEDAFSEDGFVATLTIDACGNIGTVTDRLEFDTEKAQQVAINSNDDGTLILYSETDGLGGGVDTVTVDACGMLTAGDEITAQGATAAETRTRLLRIDEIGGKNIFLALNGGNFGSYSFDACNDLTEIDTLTGIAEAGQFVGMDFLPSSGNIVVGCGYKSSTTEFFVWSLDVTANIDATEDDGPFGSSIGKLLMVFDG